MVVSQALEPARATGEPAAQLADREQEIQRIAGALRCAEKLFDDVAAALASAA